MKKLFTLIFLFATVVVSAQSILISYNGTPLANGDTINALVPELDATSEYYLDLTNQVEEAVTIKVVKTDIEMVPGATASFCFDRNCFPPTTTEAGNVTLEPGEILTQSDPRSFHLSYKTSNAGVSYVQVAFENKNDRQDKAVVIFKLVANPTSIQNVVANSSLRAYPNPASGNVNIDYSYSGNASSLNLVVKNLMGSVLSTKSLDVNGNKVMLDVSEYSSGIYFYSLEADGKPVVTKKLLVK
ncbi:MAG: T9SS type A sorting domain-containing protein [Bacteroidales bacterium]|nr:T9SS type A sorting domain-containing protein [Bacteroidales bacterium]